MRRSILVLAVVLASGTTQAHADQIVTYNMTGTITAVSPYDSPIAVGDHMSWTLQYDQSTPMFNSSGASSSYNFGIPVITNIVDQTTKSNFYTPSTMSTISLSSASPSFFEASQTASGIPYPEANYNSDLRLNVNGSLPTSNLASLPLNQLPINLSTSSFSYYYAVDLEPNAWDFNASVNSISAPMYGAPEPGSLTLFLLGAAGLAARGMRRRLKQPAACLRRRLLTH